ncbi:hypothetical protein CFC35_40380 [Streptomyces sp. FBKL.4005]|uniref:helix-turn-helix domain-containing protein n=1 Tax=Streptomyces sp. FBKL.4005 TaxID=2015515 RepID=UPI000B9647B5|nr:XRE family transcriptional regulator [Streptomyces sp. FBKL.4005]OYP10464.1 hypothetical protein CFC35_40380 [Streptomyces sp. FBKL.4005]
MSWKPLPAALSPESVRFVTRLRELKDQAGVSLAVLARQTAYSKSSWERCLNGSALPPRQAVEALCRFLGQPAGPVLALWELADLTWTARPRTNATPTRTEPPGEAPRRAAAPPGEAPRRAAAPPGEPPRRALALPAEPPRQAPAPSAESSRQAPAPRRTHPEQAGPAGHLPAPRGGATRQRPEARTETTRSRYRVRTVVLTAALVAALTLPLSWWLAGTVGRPAEPRFPAPELATAKPLCTGRACRGEDPKATWCTGAAHSVVRRRTAGGVMFEVRYSPACGAAWGRMWFSRQGDRLVVSLAGERFGTHDTDPATTGSYHSTPMLPTDTPHRVTACYHPEQGAQVCVGGRGGRNASIEDNGNGPAPAGRWTGP